MTNRKVYVAALMTSAIMLPLPSLTFAQEAQTRVDIEQIVVSGSRIRSSGFEAPTPVTVSTVETLSLTTPTNLLDAIQEMPQFLNSENFNSGSKAGIGSGRGQFLNLRNLGSGRTLILLDGIRMAPTTYTGNVNSQIIPQMLLQRVEVVTAGASAAYGSDAVSGAVNYILDHDFVGTKLEVSAGLSKYGDSFNYRVGAAGGYDLFDGRGHLMVSAERFETNGIQMKDRPTQGTISYIGAGTTPGGGAQGTPGNPYRIWENVKWNILSEGGHTVGGIPGLYFDGFKSSRPYDPGTPTGSGSTSVGGDGVALQVEQTITEDADTTQGMARFDYDINDKLNFHVMGIYSAANVDVTAGFNYFDFGHRIYSGNPYLPDDVQAQMTAGGISTLFVSKYITDSPLSPARDDTNHYTVIAGLDGEFALLNKPYRWNLSFMRGDTRQIAEEIDTPEERLLHAAVDAVVDPATGNIVCNVTLTHPGLYPGCVPFNFLGPMQASKEAVDYVHGTSRYDTNTDLTSITASLQGDLYDGWAGPISMAIGGEWRWQELDLESNSDPAVERPVTGLRSLALTAPRFWFANRASAQAKLNVKEVFGEINVPLLKDTTGFQSLDVNGAVRLTDYSTSGTVTTWKAGGTWRPYDDLLLRVTRSRDIKAPNLFDLGASGTAGRSTLNDPLSGVSAVVITAGGGNPNLKPEIGNTLSAGFVFTPSRVPNLSIAADYYQVKLSGAVSSLSIQNIVNQCFFSGGTDAICSSIERPLGQTDTSAANFPTLVRSGPVNTSFINTRGADVEVSYVTDVGGGTLTSRALLTYIEKYTTQASPQSAVVEQAGTNSIPNIRATLSAQYTNGPYSVFLQERIIGGITIGTGAPNKFWVEDPVPAQLYTDLTLNYSMPVAEADVDLYTSIKNIFDNRPPLIPGTAAPRYNFPTLGMYDIIGTTFTVGMRARF